MRSFLYWKQEDMIGRLDQRGMFPMHWCICLNVDVMQLANGCLGRRIAVGSSQLEKLCEQIGIGDHFVVFLMHNEESPTPSLFLSLSLLGFFSCLRPRAYSACSSPFVFGAVCCSWRGGCGCFCSCCPSVNLRRTGNKSEPNMAEERPNIYQTNKRTWVARFLFDTLIFSAHRHFSVPQFLHNSKHPWKLNYRSFIKLT